MTTVPFEPHRFRSTAAYYGRYRVPYPDELIADVARRVGLKKGDRVLDLGCGPAPLGIAFARLGMSVTGMDPEPEMLAAAQAAALRAGVPLQLRQGSSYDLDAGIGRFSLVTMGRSFHWMDRADTLSRLDRMLEPGGAVALFRDRRISARPDWRPVLHAAAEVYAPEQHAARALRKGPQWLPHEAFLLRSAFSEVEAVARLFEQRLTIDDLVGRAFSMSGTSPQALGNRRDEFESYLREELASLSEDGLFGEIVAAEATLAFRGAGGDSPGSRGVGHGRVSSH